MEAVCEILRHHLEADLQLEVVFSEADLKAEGLGLVAITAETAAGEVDSDEGQHVEAVFLHPMEADFYQLEADFEHHLEAEGSLVL